MSAGLGSDDHRGRTLLRAAALGSVAGLAGVAVMTVGEKAEQLITRRPDSYVAGRTLRALAGGDPGAEERSPVWNHAMHWGTGALLGALRGVWSAVGIRGWRADVGHAAARLSFDQTVENVSGFGAPPHTWPVREQVWDTAHKLIYSAATGRLADRLVAPTLMSLRGRTSH